MPLPIPPELLCEIFKFLPIQKAIPLLGISKGICKLNKEGVKRKWEKTRPLSAEEQKMLIGLIKGKCRSDRAKMAKLVLAKKAIKRGENMIEIEGNIEFRVIQLIGENEQLANIRLFFKDNSTIKIVGQREHPVTRQPRLIILYRLKPITGRLLLAFLDNSAEE